MIRRPPRVTRTDTRFPYTTLFRSPVTLVKARIHADMHAAGNVIARDGAWRGRKGPGVFRIDTAFYGVARKNQFFLSNRKRQAFRNVDLLTNQIDARDHRSEEHKSELQSLMRHSYAVFGLKNNKQTVTAYKRDF